MGRKCQDKDRCHKKNCDAKPISCPGKICKSGTYCLTRNIKGKIIVKSDDVTLDLNSFNVNGCGKSEAIKAEGVKNLTIKNGRVTNTLPHNGIHLLDVTGFNLDKLDVTNCNRAIWLDKSSVGKVTCCQLYCNVSSDEEVAAAILSVTESSCLTFEDVEICRNVKSNDSLDSLLGGIFTAYKSNGVSVDRVKVNDNEVDVNTLNEDLRGLLFLESTDCTVRNCQVNNNQILKDTGRIQAIYFFIDVKGVVIEDSQVNNNRVKGGVGVSQMVGIRVSGLEEAPASSAIIRNCQVSNNIIEKASGQVGFSLFFNPIIVSRIRSSIIDNCQVSNNQLLDPGPELNGQLQTNICIWTVNTPLSATVIKNCTVTENVNFLIGISNESISGSVENCQVLRNTASPAENNFVAIFANVTDASPTLDQPSIVKNCLIQGNSSPGAFRGIQRSFDEPEDGGPNNQTLIEGCVITDNFAGGKPASTEGTPITPSCAGLLCLGGTFRLGGDLTVKNCHISHNTAALDAPAIGIGITSATVANLPNLFRGIDNFCVENCCVFDQETDEGEGIGILIKSSLNGVIKNCVSNGNDSYGIKVEGSFDFLGNILLADNIVIDECQTLNNGVSGVEIQDLSEHIVVTNSKSLNNPTAGFADLSSVDNAFLGNYAENNGTDYLSIPTGNVATFTKSTATFDSVPNHWSNIQAVP